MCSDHGFDTGEEGALPRAVPMRRIHRAGAIVTTLVSLLLLFGIVPIHAVLYYSTGDPAYNTLPPGGNLTNSGWQFEGLWGGFLGTPMASNYFLAAQHVGGSVGDPFIFRGVAYLTVAVTNRAGSDVALWRISGTFPDYAPIYTNRDEIGKGIVVHGRGTQRGEALTTTNGLGIVKTNGWLWGMADGVQRWGTNQVADVVTDDTMGEVLKATFDAQGGADECHLSSGDSSGGVFILEGSTWKLAGINYAVDGPYRTSGTGTDFLAAVFDEGGLYIQDNTNWVLISDRPRNQPSSFYASRLSTHVDWIHSVINPDAAAEPPVLQTSVAVGGPYADDLGATVDAASKTITVPLPGGSRFYRLRGVEAVTILLVQAQSGHLVFRYQ